MSIEGDLGSTVFGKDPGVWNSVFTKDVLILLAVDVAANLSFVTTFSEDLGVFADLRLGLWGSTKEMFEVQLDESIRGVGFEESPLVFS